MHVKILVETIDSYADELLFAVENGDLHPTFLHDRQSPLQRIQLEELLVELQKFVKPDNDSSDEDSDDSSNDLEWL